MTKRKHKCRPVQCYKLYRRVGRDGRILKRPAVVRRLCRCRVCGREMTGVAQ